MKDKNFKTYLNGIRNDFKMAVDDLFNVLEIIWENTENSKTETKDSSLRSE